MTQPDEEHMSISIKGLQEWDIEDPTQLGRGLIIKTTRGDLRTIVHHDPNLPTTKAVIWVGGASGGFDGPANGLYKNLGEKLNPHITSLRLDYRIPNDLIECVMDTLAAVSFLVGTGHQDLILVGHSFGGSVVIKSASFSDQVKSVIALASQTAGATEANLVTPRSLLLIHGDEDIVLSPLCSQTIYDWAEEPKELFLLSGAGHSFRETEQELTEKVEQWIRNVL